MKDIKSCFLKIGILLLLTMSFTWMKANVGTEYRFSAHLGIYTSIDSTADVKYIDTLRSGTWDDGGAGMFPIGFGFMYGGIMRDSFCVSTNGIIKFDYDPISLGDFSPPTGPYSINVFATDLYGLPAPSGSRERAKLLYKLEGIAPNRILTVEWKDFSTCCNMLNADLNFQVKLYELSNRIEFVYGSFTPITNSIVLGLDGNCYFDNYDFHHRTFTTDWNNTYRNGSFLTSYFTLGSTIIPDSGLVYVWDHDSNSVYYYLNGRLFYDLNNNCIQDTNEAGVPNHPVNLNPINLTTYTDANGNYHFVLDSSGNYSIIPLIRDTNLSILCSGLDSIYVHLVSTINNINIPIYPDEFCPKVKINAIQGQQFPCDIISTQINYSNRGLDIARNVEIKVKFTPEHTILSSTPPWTRIDSNVYVYSLGDLNPLSHGNIFIIDSVSCTAIIGQTSCVNAIITTTNACSFIDTLWDSSSVSLTSRCDTGGFADSIEFAIMNKTLHNMSDSSSYRIYEDDLLVLNRRFILNANTELVIKVPATGKTFRLEADQVPHHPGTSIPREFVELCGSSPFSLHQILPIPFDDIEPWIDIYCSEILNPLLSYDPNLKSSSPAGIGTLHKIARDIPLEYTIEFQNTGTGPASKVVLIDAIDVSKLQINTLNMEMASHAYRLDVLGGNVLRWTFDPIYLPDSGLDEAASHGFVKFTMMPVSGLPDLTRINNYADIYFDYNSPVRTNTHFVTIADEPYTLPLPLIVNKLSHNNPCYGDEVATANLNITRGTGHYSVLWSDGSTDLTRTNLAAGVYRYTVTDWYGFTITDSIKITTPTNFNVLDTIQNLLCNATTNGAINLFVSGATPSYSYLWNDGITNKNRSLLAAGTYQLVITDANSCKDTFIYSITEPTAFSLTESIEDVNCYGASTGAIDLTLSGATPNYSYIWNDGNNDLDRLSLTAGNYTITITDANGCTKINTFIITEPTDLNIAAVIENVKCFGEANASIDLTLSGATPTYTYVWNDALISEDRTNLTAGTYTITITDANGCIKNRTYTITQPDELLINETHTDASSFGTTDGAIDISVLGGTVPYNYSWNSGATTEDLTSLAATTYTITVVDANGCESTNTIVISQPSGFSGVSTKNIVEIYPNPSISSIHIDTKKMKISSISLLDPTAKMVYNNMNPIGSIFNIDVKYLANGIYILRLEHENKNIEYTIVIQH